MRLEQLQHLLEIAKWNSMSQAAKQLYINPSTLSTSIKNLEDELGFSIFARTTQGVSVTVLGQEVLHFAERTCREYAELKRLPLEAEQITGSIEILALPAACNILTIYIMTTFKKQYPRINLHINEKYPSQILKGLKAGEAQIGITNCLEAQKKSLLNDAQKYHLEAVELGHDVLKGYVSAANPLAQREQVTLEEIKHFPLASYHEYLLNNHIPELGKFENIYGVSDRESIKKVVAVDNAVAIFPQLMEWEEPYIQNKTIIPLNIADLNYQLTYYLLYSEAIGKAPVEQDLLAVIIEQFARL